MKRLVHFHRGQRGVTLIELMVAMTIGLVVVMAVTIVITVGESHKRSTTSTNDMGQNGAYAAYIVDRAVRSAGSGFAQSWNLGVYGCKLTASRDGAAILPRAAPFPGAFSSFLGGVPANLRVAPLLIGKSQSSTGTDVLVVMNGNAGAGDVARSILIPGGAPPVGAAELRLKNTIGLTKDDLVLLAQAGTDECLIEQVDTLDPARPDVLPLGGAPAASKYYSAADPYSVLRAGGGFASVLGNAAAGNVQFQMFGVGANRTLFSYDLLRATGDGSDLAATLAIADGVVALRALYGMDTNNDGILDTWVDPGSAGHDIATMMTTPALARQIVAVRLALVLRGSNYEKKVVAPASLTLFNDLPSSLRQVLDLTGADDPHYRYRVVDSVIPLRNALLLPSP